MRSLIASVTAELTPLAMLSPFETAARRSTVAENVRVLVTLADGTVGEGEASPADYVTGETAAGVKAAIEAAAPDLRGTEPARSGLWSARLRALIPRGPTARSAVEMAILDAHCRGMGLPLWVHLGGAVNTIRTDLTLPISDLNTALATATRAHEMGYRSLKLKVGSQDTDADFARVAAVVEAAPGALIRLDANQAFTADTALRFLRRCLDAGVEVELVEQPVPRDDWDGLRAMTRESPVPVIADESVVDAAAAIKVAELGAAHGVNIKVAKAGLFGALDIIAIARAAGLKLMLGCMLESLTGIGASVHLACGTGAFDYLDLDGHTLIGIPADGQRFRQEGERIWVDAA